MMGALKKGEEDYAAKILTPLNERKRRIPAATGK
jgi:hypothetical protein